VARVGRFRAVSANNGEGCAKKKKKKKKKNKNSGRTGAAIRIRTVVELQPDRTPKDSDDAELGY